MTEADFEVAFGPTAASVGPSVGKQHAPRAITESQKTNKNMLMMASVGFPMDTKIHPVGFEPTTLGSEVGLKACCEQAGKAYTVTTYVSTICSRIHT